MRAARLAHLSTTNGGEIDAIIQRGVAEEGVAEERARRAGWKRVEASAALLAEPETPGRGALARRAKVAHVMRDGPSGHLDP